MTKVALHHHKGLYHEYVAERHAMVVRNGQLVEGPNSVGGQSCSVARNLCLEGEPSDQMTVQEDHMDP